MAVSPVEDLYPKHRPHLHVLWTGPRQMFPEQTTINNEYPVDVSVADDDEGYMSGELNLRLPKKRPNEITASWLWNF